MKNNRSFTRLLSILLALVLILEDPALAFASSAKGLVYDNETALSSSETSADASVNSVCPDDFFYFGDDTEEAGDISGVRELVSFRDENIKAYAMPDHSVKICYYPEAVNFRNDEGGWETIDNRLHFSSADAFSGFDGFTNNAAGYDVKFALEADKDKLFTIGADDERLEFRYVKAAGTGAVSDDDIKNDTENAKSSENIKSSDNAEYTDASADTVSKNDNEVEAAPGTGSSWKSRIKLVENSVKTGIATGTENSSNPAVVTETENLGSAIGGSALSDGVAENTGDSLNDNTNEAVDISAIPSLPIPQTVWYEDIEDNASFKYDLMSEGIKESIVIASPDAPYEYCFKINPDRSVPELDGEGNIIFKNENDISFIIPAPVVKDAEGARDESACYELKAETDGSYSLVLKLSEEWLKSEERSFPVDADPTIERYRKYASMDTLGDFVSIGSDDSIRKEHLYTGIDKIRNEKNALPSDNGEADISIPDTDTEEEDPADTDEETPDNADGIHYRTYIKPVLPKIPEGSVVTGAHLKLKSIKKSGTEEYYYAVLADTGKIKKNKNLFSMKWNEQPLSGKGSLALSELDIIDYGKKGTDELDITAAVKGWYEGADNGDCLCLIMSNETEAGIGKKKKSGKATDEIKPGLRQIEPVKSSKTPFFTIEYRDITGAEDYYSCHSQTAGNAGSSYVNDFTGRLTFTHQDAASAGGRMPLSVSHVYDDAFGERDKRWQTSEDGGAYGYNWHLSTDVRLLVPAGETDVSDFPYVYIDADGTKHYFKKQKVVYYANGAKQTASKDDDEYPAAADEDGLGLFVVPVKDDTLKSTYPIKIVDKSSSSVMYFDKFGYLGMITDSNQREDGKNAESKERNAVTFTHEKAKYLAAYDAESSKKAAEELKSLVSSLKTTLEASANDIDKCKDIAAKALSETEVLTENVLLFNVSYKAAKSLYDIRGYMQDIIDNADIKGSKIKELSEKAAKKCDDILSEDFDISPMITTKVTDAAGVSSTLSYDAEGHLVSMTDHSEHGEAITYTYDGGLLTEIKHPCGTRASLIYDDNGCLAAAMDECGSALIYIHDDNKRVTRISEYSLKLSGNSESSRKNAVKKLEKELSKYNKNPKKNGSKSIAGQTVFINYDNYNETVYTFSGKDDKAGSGDDIENVLNFDNKGRAVSVYTRNAADKSVTGGQICTYADKADDGADAVNKIKDSAVTGSPVVNYAGDSGFEKKKKDEAKWTVYSGTGKAEVSNKEKYLGKKSAYIKLSGNTSKEMMPYFEQNINVPVSGVYTASVYVKTKNMVNARVCMYVSSKNSSSVTEDEGDMTDSVSDDDAVSDNDADEGLEEDPDDAAVDGEDTSDTYDDEADEDSEAADAESIEYDAVTPSEIDNGWKRLEAKIKVKAGKPVTLRLGLYGEAGEAYFDCVQVEKGSLANKYNLLPNSGFEGNYASGRRSDVIPEGWTYTNSQGFVDASLVTDADSGKDIKVVEGKKALCIQGSEDQKKVLVINPNFGTGNASYTFSCYVKADCAPSRGKRKVGIYIEGDMPEFDEDSDPDLAEYIKKYIDKDDIPPAAYAEINTSVKGWQYVQMALPGRDWSGRLIEIHFDYECGSLMVDACMLTRDGVDVRTYSSSGKLISSKGNERVTRYATDSRDRTKKMVTAGGARQVYTYDKNTNDLTRVKSTFSQSKSKTSRTDYSYDRFGNVISTELSWSSGKKITTENTYDDSGSFVTASKDSRGNTISYEYDHDNGTLKSITDAEGKKTSYEYDSYLNPAKISLSGSDGNEAGAVSFEYGNRMHSALEKIEAGDLRYSFEYDSFGNVKGIKKNGEKLASYRYNSYNGKAYSVQYGNGNRASLKYDDRELLSERNFGGKDKLKFEYDSLGRLSRISDKYTGLTYRLTYDAAGRVTYSDVYDTNIKNDYVRFASSYDKAGRQSEFSYSTGDRAYSYKYGYTTDDKISAEVLPSGGYFKRVYDNIGRTKTESFTPQKKKATGETKKSYDTGATVNSTLTYLGTDRNGAEGTDASYKYTTKLLAGLKTTVKAKNGSVTAVSDSLSYDKAGRVSAFNDISYTYDALGRLIKAENKKTGDHWEYAYDKTGNLITSKSLIDGKEYTEEYAYDNKTPDELTAYVINGEKQNVSKYKGGNPLSYRGCKLKWHRGSELESIETENKGGGESLKAGYTYSYEGIRLKKSINGTETKYVLNGNTILSQSTESNGDEELLNFYYSPEGKLLEIGFSKNGSAEEHYSVIKNAMGDVTALYTADGTLVGSYSYDPYGKIISISHNEAFEDSTGILEKNPFRYRGYYFDEEIGWYYLNSRYYDPEVKRFINADSTELLTEECSNLMQYNLYLYCNDNPINNTDEGGNLSNWQKVAIGIGVIAVVGIVTVATAGTGTALACVAAGAFEGAVAGAASGAVIGAATGAVSSRISTGSWDGAGQAAIDGAASGFMTGAITGAITGGITSNHCFIAGTVVVTADGYKKIEDIRTGDRVLSADEENGEISIKSVVQTFINETDELIHLQVGDEELVTTPGHPFFIYGHGFEYAGNLRAGDILVNVNGEKVILEKVQHEILESHVKVYNFEVEDFHTYFVGKEGVWVHNICGTKPSPNTLGKQGEDFVSKKIGLEHNTKIININGSQRIPDFIDEERNIIVESKNVANLSYTRQLRDYVAKAQEMGTKLILYVREKTNFTGPLQKAIDDGIIKVEYFSW